MWKTPHKIIVLIALFNLLVVGKGEMKEEGRHFHRYPPLEEERNQIFPYPSATYPFKEDWTEHAKNPLLPLFGKGMNLILLKLGVLGIIKAITAIVFLGFLLKVPILLLKATFIKSLFLPFLAAPLLVYLFTNQMTQSGESTNEKPTEPVPEMPEMMGMMPEMNVEMGRELTQNLAEMGWRSMRMFMESDQCAERISCMIGAYYKNSSMGSIFSRMLKYLHHSSPQLLQERITLIRSAFDKGKGTSTCMAEDYKCQSPALLIQHGVEKMRIL